MITKAQSRLMFRKKNQLSYSDAKAYIKSLKIQALQAKHNTTLDHAKKLYKLSVYNAGILSEEKLRDLFNSWMPKSAKRTTGSPMKEKLAIPLIADRVGDVLFKVDDRNLVVENKQRGTPGTLYDSMVDKNSEEYQQSLHILKNGKTVWHVLTEQDFKALIVDRIAPKVLQKKYEGMTDYTRMFNKTTYKTDTIDVLALNQKEYPWIFFCRPNTYDLLLSRCTDHTFMLSDEVQPMDNAQDLIKYCNDNYKYSLANKLGTSMIDLHMIETGEKSIELPMYKRLARLYATLMKPKKSKKSAKMQ